LAIGNCWQLTKQKQKVQFGVRKGRYDKNMALKLNNVPQFIKVARKLIVKNYRLIESLNTFGQRIEIIDWAIVFCRDAGVALIVGTILGGVVDQLNWFLALLLLLSSSVLCYISLRLLIVKAKI